MAEKKHTVLGPIVALSLVVLAVVVVLVGRQYFGPDADKTSTGVPIGGPFTLTDQDGRTVTDKTYAGSYMVIYFGYTFCPDVCPTSLSLIGQAMEQLTASAPQQAARIQPIFISVDPERDTPALLKEYVKHFHPRMVGLTGTADQVAAAAQAYRVFYSKVVEKGAKADEYLMDHSSITYVIGPDGAYATHFGHGTEPDVMAKKLASLP